MRNSWTQRIERAEELAGNDEGAAPLLSFYGRVLRCQSEIHGGFGQRPPVGAIEEDATDLVSAAGGLLRAVADDAPPQLAEEARALLTSRGLAERLVDYWRERSDRDFFGKAILQPYAQWLSEQKPQAGETPHAARACPRCGGAPQVSVLNTTGSASLDIGGRQLLCATCLTPWTFPRVVCAHCGEDDDKKVGYFHAAPFEHLRVDACESCRHYIKSVDIGKLGLAVPLIDEVAGASLDLWARDHGYEKIELNLLGV